MSDAAPLDANAAAHAQLLANAPAIVYSLTGAGKSSLAPTLADYIWERSGALYGTKDRRVLRYYALDSGGFPQRVAALAKLGVIELWRPRNHVDANVTCDRISKAWWPAGIDSRTGIAASDAPLLPPVITAYTQVCQHCRHEVRTLYTGQFNAIQCPACSVMVSERSVRITESINPAFRHVGGCFADGMTSMQDWILEELEEATAQGKLGGEKAAIGGILESGDQKYAGNSRAHVGFGQVRAQRWCGYSANVQGLLVPFHYTALEDRGSDDKSANIYGPKISGTARTHMVPGWVGHCLYLRLMADGERRMYLRSCSFPEEMNFEHLAKVRSDPGTLPDYLSDVDPGTGMPLPTWTRFSLKYLYDQIDAVAVAVDETVEQQFPDALASVRRSELPAALAGVVSTGANATQPQPMSPGMPPGVTKASLPTARGRRSVSRPPQPVAEPVPQPTPAETVAAVADVAAAAAAAPVPNPPPVVVAPSLPVAAPTILPGPPIATGGGSTASPTTPPPTHAVGRAVTALPTAAPRRPRGLPTATPGPRATGATAAVSGATTGPPPPPTASGGETAPKL